MKLLVRSATAVIWLCAMAACANAQSGINDAHAPVYLFATFKEPEQDGLRFAYSFDGYHWSNVPGLFLKANVGRQKIMRDPSICRGPDGTWHLVWTCSWHTEHGFGYASSKDLVHWSEQQWIPVMTHEPDTVNVWAPELFYDEREQQFIICWASTIPGRFPEGLEPRTNNHRLYFTTTRDFKTFAPTKLFFDPGFSVIDGQILKDGDRYVLLFKDNTRPQRNIRVAFSDSPLGPWRDVSTNLTAPFTEGPCGLKLGDEWLVYFEAYRDKQYCAMKTRDFKTFTDVTAQMTFPPGLKHGTVFVASKKDLDYLLKVGTQQVWNVRLPWVSPVSRQEVARRLAEIEKVANRGPFKPDWATITNLFRPPRWYQDAKFGLFIHWGVYSVPAFGSEWYPRNMYIPGTPEYAHHLATYGPHKQFGYKDFVPMFKAEKFDPRAWLRLFKESGARYVVPVAEHHDGFAMYASELTDWCAAKKGPRRDVLGELAREARAAGLVFGASYHRAEHWFYFDNGLYCDSDVRDTNYAALYGPASNRRTAEAQAEPPDKDFLDDWLLRACEIVDRYQPEVFYLDWWIYQPVFQPYLKTFAAYYYNRAAEWGKQVAINFKEWEGRSFPRGAGVLDVERGRFSEVQPWLWQTCTSVSRNSWGYVTNHVYKDADELVDELVDVVSKNGAMLLNIGPRADGTIPEREQQILREIGAWLKINGEAIYGTRPWRIYGEGPTQAPSGPFTDASRQPFTSRDIRFTTKGDTLYAVALAWPDDRQLVIKSLGSNAGLAKGKIRKVQLLGYKGRISWQDTPDGLVVHLPAAPPCDFAVTLKITGLKLAQ
ncbi:MAG: alpha-L-fucosidase [Verrucomicrobiae bacterium]|nr:alpha-L-fucosidase [Verrucomicrobiae bacterium]